MTSKTKKYIIENLKWPITSLDYLGKYFIMFFPFIMIYAGLGKSTDNNVELNLIGVGIISFIYIIYRIESERKFRELLFKKDLSTLEIGKLLEKNGWILTNWSDGVIQLRTNSSYSYESQTVTIIRITKEKILVNTQPNGKPPFTFFKDKLNYNQVKSVLNN